MQFLEVVAEGGQVFDLIWGVFADQGKAVGSTSHSNNLGEALTQLLSNPIYAPCGYMSKNKKANISFMEQ